MGKDNKTTSREVDIIGLIKRIFAEKKILLKFLTISGILGVLVALNTSKYYTASVVLAPESTNDLASASSKLGSMSSLLGLKLGSGLASDAIFPEIYPDVFSSTDFIVGLFDIPIKQEKDNEQKTYYHHLIYDTKIPFWNYPLTWVAKLIRGKNGATEKIDPFWLNKEQTQICEVIRNNISCKVDKKTDIITISVTDGDKLVSATMADTLQNRLQRYITMYRTNKARNDLAYMEKLFQQSKVDYLKAQHEYASATDSNIDPFLTSIKGELSNLENEMQLKYNIYAEVTQQLQLTRQRVQERTPAFTIIQSATVPDRPSSMPRIVIVFLYLILGFMANAVWVLSLRNLYYKYKANKQK